MLGAVPAPASGPAAARPARPGAAPGRRVRPSERAAARPGRRRSGPAPPPGASLRGTAASAACGHARRTTCTSPLGWRHRGRPRPPTRPSVWCPVWTVVCGQSRSRGPLVVLGDRPQPGRLIRGEVAGELPHGVVVQPCGPHAHRFAAAVYLDVAHAGGRLADLVAVRAAVPRSVAE